MSDENARLFESAIEQMRGLTAEALAEIVPELAAYKAALGEQFDAEFGTYTFTDEQFDELLLMVLTMGLILGSGEEEAPATDLIVPLDPEEALRIMQGLIGNGTTITFTVVRDQNTDS